MFSGIVQGTFNVTEVKEKSGLIHYAIRLNKVLIKYLQIGASMAVDGVCQTVVAIDKHTVYFDAIEETLLKTTLKHLAVGRQVHIERSLRYGDEVGGHLVSGHVDGTAKVLHCAHNNNVELKLKVNPGWMKYILYKGFISIDGVSLTVSETNTQGIFSVYLIPETLRVTHLGAKKAGDLVNIELDYQTKVIVSAIEHTVQSSLK